MFSASKCSSSPSPATLWSEATASSPTREAWSTPTPPWPRRRSSPLFCRFLLFPVPSTEVATSSVLASSPTTGPPSADSTPPPPRSPSSPRSSSSMATMDRCLTPSRTTSSRPTPNPLCDPLDCVFVLFIRCSNQSQFLWFCFVRRRLTLPRSPPWSSHSYPQSALGSHLWGPHSINPPIFLSPPLILSLRNSLRSHSSSPSTTDRNVAVLVLTEKGLEHSIKVLERLRAQIITTKSNRLQ